MKVKTSELTATALDWAVAKACFDDTLAIYFDEATGEPLHRDDMDAPEWRPSTNWAQGGPIIERERITVEFLRWDNVDGALPVWLATRVERYSVCEAEGFSPLIAAMRCFVASRLGDEVEIPEELCN